MLEALAALPGFEQRTQSFLHVASGMGKSSFAAGDLGDGEWKPSTPRSRRPRPRSVLSKLEVGASGRGANIDEPPRRSRRKLVIGAVVTVGLLLAVGAVGLRKGPSADRPTASPSAEPAVARPVSGPPPAPESARAEELPKQAQAPAVEEADKPAVKTGSEPARGAASAKNGPSSGVRSAGAAARSAKTHGRTPRLRRGARGTEMSDQFE